MSLVEERKQQPANRSDGELVVGIRQSNEKDFTLLYERYYQRVYNFSYLRLRNHADTEEAVQETFTAVFRSIDAFQGKSSVISWIYGIAKNTVNNSIRRAIAREQRVERAESEMIQNLHTTYAADPEDHLRLQRCEESIRSRLESVSDWQAQIFVMRHVDNLPIDEIVSRTSRSNDSVRSSLCRVKRMLVEAIESGGEAARAASLQGGGV
ncbi:MAG: sigma-70 family RNA polymerase sigma factor [Deltaproteobacteria bacterium]|nr:sigma-70 family RNA polymerase sigma factor [Deltaproteobacteria bacterium]